MNRNSKWFRILFLVIAAIFVISTCAFVNTKVQDAKAQKEYERLQELARKQQEEEDNADKMITRMKLFGSDAKALYDLDQENAARVYSVPSPLAAAE